MTKNNKSRLGPEPAQGQVGVLDSFALPEYYVFWPCIIPRWGKFVSQNGRKNTQNGIVSAGKSVIIGK